MKNPTNQKLAIAAATSLRVLAAHESDKDVKLTLEQNIDQLCDDYGLRRCACCGALEITELSYKYDFYCEDCNAAGESERATHQYLNNWINRGLR